MGREGGASRLQRRQSCGLRHWHLLGREPRKAGVRPPARTPGAHPPFISEGEEEEDVISGLHSPCSHHLTQTLTQHGSSHTPVGAT